MLNVDAREQMIEQQVRAWDVLDANVLALFRKVPRERFVPADHRFLAFADAEVPLPHSQHMLRPSVVGRMLQALDLVTGDRVLQIGAGSGYITACLATAVTDVQSIEILPELATLARDNLASLGIGNAQVSAGDGFKSDATRNRYTAIAVTGSMPIYQEIFQRQLEIGGRLFVVVGSAPAMDARLIRRTAEESWTTESLFETVIDPLINAPQPPGFTF
ncbi:MAG TPA: protein-L-isoaspartate O-methyltransferase [Steroidobacteraceae bacterium]|jgi:protein-L-isoaspartate(D-aspartate) O-methyltransferase